MLGRHNQVCFSVAIDTFDRLHDRGHYYHKTKPIHQFMRLTTTYANAKMKCLIFTAIGLR